MEDLILDRQSRLPDALKYDPAYAPHHPSRLGILSVQRKERIKQGDVDIRLRGPKNNEGRWRFGPV